MAGFQEIIGQEHIKEHLLHAMEQNKVSHAYLLQGELGAGKEFIAKAFAAALQCERGTGNACGQCRSCKQIESRNHPDVIWVTHEKPNTIGVEDYRVYRYEGKLNLLENGVVLLCWKDGDDLNSSSIRAFLSTDVSLSNEQILSYYCKRWSIENYFRTAKVYLGMDRYQVRSTKSIDRYFALLLFVTMCCTYSGQGSLIDGIHQYRKQKRHHWIEYIYKQAQSGVSLAQIKTQLRVA